MTHRLSFLEEELHVLQCRIAEADVRKMGPAHWPANDGYRPPPPDRDDRYIVAMTIGVDCGNVEIRGKQWPCDNNLWTANGEVYAVGTYAPATGTWVDVPDQSVARRFPFCVMRRRVGQSEAP